MQQFCFEVQFFLVLSKKKCVWEKVLIQPKLSYIEVRSALFSVRSVTFKSDSRYRLEKQKHYLCFNLHANQQTQMYIAIVSNRLLFTSFLP